MHRTEDRIWHRVFVELFLSFAFLMPLALSQDASKSDKPNVVIITIDTLRPSDLKFHGFGRDTSPFMTELAKSSHVMLRAFSTSSWTAPATASIFTGLHPEEHGVITGFSVPDNLIAVTEGMWRNGISDEVPTMPELFAKAGYSTWAAAANGNVCEEMGFTRGFEHFWGSPKRFGAPYVPANVLYNLVAKWVGRNGSLGQDPSFLYLHFMDPHMPYHAHELELREPPRGSRVNYRSEIEFTDKYIAHIRHTMGWDDSTLLVFLSDHGEEFTDHDGWGHGPTLYNELNQVLMMFHAPGLGIRPGNATENVSLLDVLPTILDLIGEEIPSHLPGLSLTPILLDTDEKPSLQKKLRERTLFGHRVDKSPTRKVVRSALYQNWKFIQWWDGRQELYNHDGDIKEQENLINQNPDIVKVLKQSLTEHIETLKRYRTKEVNIPLSPEDMEQLEALGYLN